MAPYALLIFVATIGQPGCRLMDELLRTLFRRTSENKDEENRDSGHPSARLCLAGRGSGDDAAPLK
jgi:hypothetical protein